jgi:hypothetical protein
MGNPPLVVGLLINGVAYAAILVVVGVLLSRFTSEIVWRSFLVLFLFIAAGLYIVFAPETYTIACLSFDLLVAAYIAIAHVFGLVRGRRPAPR